MEKLSEVQDLEFCDMRGIALLLYGKEKSERYPVGWDASVWISSNTKTLNSKLYM